MDIQQFYEICSRLHAVEETFPFDEDTLVMKVGGKMFALTSLKEWERGNPSVSVKADPEYSAELREHYLGITPGYHMNKIHWNTVKINDDVPDSLVISLIRDSYNLVFSSLTKKIQNQLNPTSE